MRPEKIYILLKELSEPETSPERFYQIKNLMTDELKNISLGAHVSSLWFTLDYIFSVKSHSAAVQMLPFVSVIMDEGAENLNETLNSIITSYFVKKLTGNGKN